MIKINDMEVEHHEVEWGVEFVLDGETIQAPLDTEEEARNYVGMISPAKVIARHVFETAWADAP